MKRKLLLLGVVVLAVGALVAWRCYTTSRPSPGDSLFADFEPRSLYKTWAIVGYPGSPNVAFVNPDGAVQPNRNSHSVHWFVYDRDSRILYSPLLQNTRARNGFWTIEGQHRSWDLGPQMQVRERVYANKDTCIVDLSVQNLGGRASRLSLFVAAVPYQVVGLMASGYEAEFDEARRCLSIDGSVLFQTDREPNDTGALTGDDGTDITCYIRRAILPRANQARGKSAQASGAMRFDLQIGADDRAGLNLVMPLADVRPEQLRPVRETTKSTFADATRAWSARLGRVSLQLPDQRVIDCFNGSLAYLIMLCGDGKPVPGPAKYNSFWLRDAAYIADALFYAGQGDLIPPALAEIRSMQLPDGGFLAKTRGNADELDAPGEAIYTFVQHYKRTGDRKLLQDAWPMILSASKFVRDKRVSADGILPPSVSAEDLGSGKHQHYWDDFWCVRGLRDAAFAARELGKAKDAEWMQAEADSLLKATLASVRSLKTSYIPNGPQDLTSSAMARGTSCGLWPCDVLDPNDPLTTSSFDTYWDKWIAPSKGGFIHKGHYWPYAGLDLAQGYIMLGQRERAWTMLDWTLKHDPTKGFYSWPEGMFTDNLTLAEGDMPHGWMCASYISLVRNMLVRESGQDLVLMSGVPRHWLRRGATIAVRDLPVQFGTLSYTARVDGDSLRLTIDAPKKARALRVILPSRREITLSATTRSATIPLQ